MSKQIEKQFMKFVIPSMLTMLLQGLYIIVDGFFVGQAIGDVGLAGINIAWQITAITLPLAQIIMVLAIKFMNNMHNSKIKKML